MPADARRANFLSATIGGLVVAAVVAALALGGVFDSDEDGSVSTRKQRRHPPTLTSQCCMTDGVDAGQ